MKFMKFYEIYRLYGLTVPPVSVRTRLTGSDTGVGTCAESTENMKFMWNLWVPLSSIFQFNRKF